MNVREYEAYHVHTAFSNALTQPDSTMFIRDYAEEYRKRGTHHVLCISEHGNRSNVWEQFDICEEFKSDKDKKGNPQNPYEMTPLAAAEAYFVPNRLPNSEGQYDGRNFHLILVAKGMEGYYELNEAISEANLTGFYKRARVDLDILSRLNYKNFICTTACLAGVLRDDDYEHLCCQLHEIFRENFYLEVQDHPQKAQAEINMRALRMYNRYHWPLIFGTDSHYIKPEDAALRKELLLSAKIDYGDEDAFILDLPTSEEACRRFEEQGVLTMPRIEEAMENTLILREFEGVKFTREKKIPTLYPELSMKERNELFIKTVTEEYTRKNGPPTEEEAAEIQAEMDVVTSTDTADYFLTMKKIIDRGKELGGVLTTTGRGSAASFVCNYALGFSSINRLHSPVKMLPERFVSADRLANGVPDIDCNMFGTEAFDEAGKELLGEYGCLPMVAFGTNKTLSAFKMLSRARNLDFETSNEVSKQIQAYELDVKHAKENNSDDPDYDVDEDVRIDSYVDDKYLGLIEESKQYQGIITSLSPHPCARLLLDKDIRREIGVVRVKSKSGSKDAIYAAYIDGKTADSLNFIKADFLRVDVVGIIAATYKAIGREVMTVDELLQAVKDDEKVWKLYWDGFTQGLNQVEKEGTTRKTMQYKPRNVEELTGLIAGIRPGFRSMINTFLARDRFEYGIPSLDNLLKTKVIPDSFLEYDEQILVILKAAGIPGPEAYSVTKAIKKKRTEKVLAAKEKFKIGFTKRLQEQEGTSEEKAHEVVDQIWTIIENAANYMFCAAHAFSMACDSLYCAWLKVHYPYELYLTMLKLYDEKKNTEKISAIISEMKRYKEIKLISGKWGQDNRDWTVDKTNHTISQSLSSIKSIPKKVAEDLYWLSQQEEALMGTEIIPAKLNKAGKEAMKQLRKEIKAAKDNEDNLTEEEAKKLTEEFQQRQDAIWTNPDFLEEEAKEIRHMAKLDWFANVLRAMHMNTSAQSNHIKILIELGYFDKFGKSGKLMKIYEQYFDRLNNKKLKSFKERMEELRAFELFEPDVELPLRERLQSEQENIGICLTTVPEANRSTYFVRSVDEKWGTRVVLYSISNGKSGEVRFRKDDIRKKPVAPNQLITIVEGNRSPRYTYKGGKRTPIPGETEYWVRSWDVLRPA